MWRVLYSSARARNAEILFWIGENFRLSAILNGFSEVTVTEPLLLKKNREDIEYGTQELRNEPKYRNGISRSRNGCEATAGQASAETQRRGSYEKKVGHLPGDW